MKAHHFGVFKTVANHVIVKFWREIVVPELRKVFDANQIRIIGLLAATYTDKDTVVLSMK